MIVATDELHLAESALVLDASGGVGNAALKIAAYLVQQPMQQFFKTKAAALSELAQEVIDYTADPFDGRIRRLTDGRGIDFVANHVVQETWQASVGSLAKDGRMVICGATSGADPDIDIRSVHQYYRQIIDKLMGQSTLV